MQRFILGLLTLSIALIPVRATDKTDPPKKRSDAEITRLLVGKWTTEEGKDNEPKVKATFVYRADSTFTVEATIATAEKTDKIVVSGTWKVVDGVILDTVVKSSTENFKEGRVTKDTVLSIDEQTLRYTTEKGRERVWKRVKE